MADPAPHHELLTPGGPSFDASAPLLEISGLRTDIALKRSTVHAVDGVDLTLAPGECLGLVGESGCGKTITALSVLGLLPTGGHVAGGSVRLEGVDLLALEESAMQQVRGGSIGMVFQDPLTSLNPTITVGNQIAEAVRLHRDVSRAVARRRALEVLELVGIAQARNRLDDYPHQFSGGMRQRVMIAIALACDPRLLIADEPTTALDVTIQAQILELIDRLRRELEMAVLLVTHDLGVVAGRADRVAVMYAGKIVETADATELFARPRHRYTQALFDALPEKATARRQRLASIPGLPPDLSADLTGCRFAPRCAFAQDDCRAEQPPFVGAGGHRHACLHPVRDDELARARETSPGAERDAGRAEVLLSVEHLVKDFPISHHVFGRTRDRVSAVADVSLEIHRGETFGLVGESGSGKSTLGRLIVGLEKPDAGTIRLDGRDVSTLSSRELRAVRRRVQFMFQDPYSSLDPRMRVGQLLREPLAIQRIGSREEQRRRVEEMLDSVGLPGSSVDRFPHEFSGGQRQRLGLARALILRPELVVADEPVSALDVSIQAQILNSLRELQERLDLTYLVISHDLSVIRYLSDRIGVMYLGKLVEDGPSEEVYHHPLHPYTHGLIATVPVADPVQERARVSAPLQGEPPSAVDPPSGCRFRTRCPLAQQVCADEEPPLRTLRPSHRVACHFPLAQATLDESPTARGISQSVPGR